MRMRTVRRELSRDKKFQRLLLQCARLTIEVDDEEASHNDRPKTMRAALSFGELVNYIAAGFSDVSIKDAKELAGEMMAATLKAHSASWLRNHVPLPGLPEA